MFHQWNPSSELGVPPWLDGNLQRSPHIEAAQRHFQFSSQRKIRQRHRVTNMEEGDPPGGVTPLPPASFFSARSTAGPRLMIDDICDICAMVQRFFESIHRHIGRGGVLMTTYVVVTVNSRWISSIQFTMMGWWDSPWISWIPSWPWHAWHAWHLWIPSCNQTWGKLHTVFSDFPSLQIGKFYLGWVFLVASHVWLQG